MAKSRKVSSISKEFDGKEVQGKLIERSGLFGSKVSKEVFKMPGGGKHIEKTRTNKKGDVVSRLSRDTKVNPLKLFNDNKQQAIKKAGGEMSAYKKSLKKFQGDVTGSQVVTPPTNTPRPRLSDITPFAVDPNQDINVGDKGDIRKANRGAKAASMNSGIDLSLNNENLYGNQAPIMSKPPMVRLQMGFEKQRKGGSVKRKRK